MESFVSSDAPAAMDVAVSRRPLLRQDGESKRATVLVALCVVLAGAAILRIWNFPARYDVRDVDEQGYMNCGLVLLEGIQPGYKASGAAVETWLSWTYAGAHAAKHVLERSGPEAAVPITLRPYVAVNHALFDIYADMSSLRNFLLIEQLLLSLVACWMAFRLGYVRAGLAGAIVVGGLVAVSPLFVDYVATSRPYADAWALAVIAIAYAAIGKSERRAIYTGILFGLAVGCRIDMISLFPLVWWEFWNRDGSRGLFKQLATMTFAAVVTTLVVAPWLVTGLIGNLRMILSYRVVGVGTEKSRLYTLWVMMWHFGFGPVVLLLVIGMGMLFWKRKIKSGIATLIAVLMLLSAFGGAQNSLRYQGAMLIAVIVTSALAMGVVRLGGQNWSIAIAAAVLVLPAVESVAHGVWFKRQYVGSEQVGWVEQHVPAGTTVYAQAEIRKLLPTPAAADRMWSEVTNLEAYQAKMMRGMSQLNVSLEEVPRALSEENLVLDRSNTRGYFILGTPDLQPERPRYDLHLYLFSPIFETQDVVAAFKKTGGVVMWGLRDAPPKELGEPVMKWEKPGATPEYIFVSPDVKVK